MDWMLVLLVLSLGVEGRDVACPVIECSTSLPPGVCFSRDPETLDVSIQSCPQNQTCEFNRMSSSGSYNINNDLQYCRPASWLPTKKFPGEPCTNSQECVSGNCVDVCIGLPTGQPCIDYVDCSPGLICHNRMCMGQAPFGMFCDRSDDCVNDCLCYHHKCSAYFSLPDGSEDVEDSYLCESGYTENGQCKPAPGNKNPPDSPCYDNSDCELTNGEDGKCLCGMNSEGIPFCASLQGDAEFSALKAAMLSVLPKSRSCHFNTSLSLRCPQHAADPNFPTFLNALYTYYYRPAIIGIPPCVQEVMPFSLNYSYSTIDLGSSDSSTSTVVIIVTVCVFTVLLLVGVVCFFCVRKYAQQDTFENQLRQRIRNNEYGVVEVFLGAAQGAQSAEGRKAQFTMEDIALSDKNRKFLKVGIPVAIEVHEETHEPVGEPELVPPSELLSEKQPLRPNSVGETSPNSAVSPLRPPPA